MTWHVGLWHRVEREGGGGQGYRLYSLIGALFVSGLISLPASAPDPSTDHSLTWIGNLTQYISVGGCSPTCGVSSATLYSAQGPSDKTWTIRVWIALNGGDPTQCARWHYELTDNSHGVVGDYADGATYWHNVNTYTFRDTFNPHVSSTWKLIVWIWSCDVNTQEFNVHVTSSWWDQ